MSQACPPSDPAAQGQRLGPPPPAPWAFSPAPIRVDGQQARLGSDRFLLGLRRDRGALESCCELRTPPDRVEKHFDWSPVICEPPFGERAELTKRRRRFELELAVELLEAVVFAAAVHDLELANEVEDVAIGTVEREGASLHEDAVAWRIDSLVDERAEHLPSLGEGQALGIDTCVPKQLMESRLRLVDPDEATLPRSSLGSAGPATARHQVKHLA